MDGMDSDERRSETTVRLTGGDRADGAARLRWMIGVRVAVADGGDTLALQHAASDGDDAQWLELLGLQLPDSGTLYAHLPDVELLCFVRCTTATGRSTLVAPPEITRLGPAGRTTGPTVCAPGRPATARRQGVELARAVPKTRLPRRPARTAGAHVCFRARVSFSSARQYDDGLSPARRIDENDCEDRMADSLLTLQERYNALLHDSSTGVADEAVASAQLSEPAETSAFAAPDGPLYEEIATPDADATSLQASRLSRHIDLDDVGAGSNRMAHVEIIDSGSMEVARAASMANVEGIGAESEPLTARHTASLANVEEIPCCPDCPPGEPCFDEPATAGSPSRARFDIEQTDLAPSGPSPMDGSHLEVGSSDSLLPGRVHAMQLVVGLPHDHRFDRLAEARLGRTRDLLKKHVTCVERDSYSRIIAFRERANPNKDYSPQGCTMLPSGRVFCYGNSPNDKPGWFVFDPLDTLHGSGSDSWIEVKPTRGDPPVFGIKTVVTSYDGRGRKQTSKRPQFYRSLGHTLTADGRYVSIGGDREYPDVTLKRTAPDTTGWTGMADTVAYKESYDNNSGWTGASQELPKMQGIGVSGTIFAGRRFYPTLTRLPDGSLLASGGLDVRDTYERCTPRICTRRYYCPVCTRYTVNRSVEQLDPPPPPKSGAYFQRTWKTLSSQTKSPPEVANSPDMVDWLYDYTSVFVLPEPPLGRDIMMIGQHGRPVFFDYRMRKWSGGRDGPNAVRTRPAKRGVTPVGTLPNHGASVTMLPIRLKKRQWGYNNGSVLVAGGTRGPKKSDGTGWELGAWEDAVDVFDPVDNKWKYHRNLKTPRSHTWAIVLPDGKVLVLAGGYTRYPIPEDPPGDELSASEKQRLAAEKERLWQLRRQERSDVAQLIDPRDGFAVCSGQATIDEFRSHHGVAILLRDGSVLLAGGKTGGPFDGEHHEAPDFRYYYPPYYADKHRPTIVSAKHPEVSPATLSIGGKMTIEVSSDWPISEAVLIGLPSATHSVNMNDRHVELQITRTGQYVMGRTPPTAQYAIIGPRSAEEVPPGHYMLFVLDSRRIPAKLAKIVKIVPSRSGPLSVLGSGGLRTL